MLLFLLFLLLPSQLAFHFWPPWSFVSGIPLDYLSPTLYFTDLVIIALLLVAKIRPRVPLWVIVFATLNTSASISPFVSMYKWLRLLEYFWLIRYLISNLKPQTSNLSLSLAVIWTSLLAWAQFILQRSLGGPWYWLGERTLNPALPSIAKINFWDFGLVLRPYGTMPHPNALAGYLLVSGLIIYFSNSLKIGNWKLKVSLWSLVIAGITIPVTFSRTAIFLEAIILLAWFLSKISTRLFFLLIPSAIPLAILLSMFGNPASLAERLALVQKSLFIIHKFPLLGTGLGTFPAFQNLQLATHNLQLGFQPVHNLYLLLASELGLPAVFLIGYWTINSLKIAREARDSWSRNWKLIIPILAVATTALADHYWLTLHQNSLLLAVLFSTIALEFKNAKKLSP